GLDRSRIRGVEETPGLSASTLTLLGATGDPALLVVRFTHRQRGAMENIRFVLEEALEGRSTPSGDADRLYADGVAAPIRNAQAMVGGGRETAVLRRLLGYLLPYKRQ